MVNYDEVVCRAADGLGYTSYETAEIIVHVLCNGDAWPRDSRGECVLCVLEQAGLVETVRHKVVRDARSYFESVSASWCSLECVDLLTWLALVHERIPEAMERARNKTLWWPQGALKYGDV